MESNNHKLSTHRSDIQISKRLSWILRHGALTEGLSLSSEGYIPLHEILSCKGFETVSVKDIERIVLNNDKQRFTLRSCGAGNLQIKANQGHSIDIQNLELTPVTNSEQVQSVIHGTYFKFWEFIKGEGLCRGKRIHIHFSDCLPNDKNISGIRASSEIYIYINLAKALSEGLKFYISSNNVILSSGDDAGYIKPKYFMKVCRASDGGLLNF